MLAARVALCQVCTRLPQIESKFLLRLNRNDVRIRLYATQPRGGSAFRSRTRRSLKEIITAPASDTAFVIGKGALAGASAFGLGALCYYGLGLSNELGAVDRAVMWPEYVRDRIRSTYMYFGGSVIVTAISAACASRTPIIMRVLMQNSLLSVIGTLVAVVGTGMTVQMLPYNEGFGMKQLALMGHSALLGAVIAPLCFLGGPMLIRAAWYTAGVVGGLSCVAACAPSEKFLSVGGPLAMGLGVVFVSSLGTFFFPATTALGSGLYSISIYGGLVVFGGLLLYDTQRVIKTAEMTPQYSGLGKPFDPINASLAIYMDTLNIFIRIVQLLASGGGSGSGRRK